MKNKKAQLTVFIILGIVILTSFALVFYINKGIGREQDVLGTSETPLEL